MTNTENLLIIGGSDAGISAALKAKELKPELQIKVLLADEYQIYQFVGYLMPLAKRCQIGVR